MVIVTQGWCVFSPVAGFLDVIVHSDGVCSLL